MDLVNPGEPAPASVAVGGRIWRDYRGALLADVVALALAAAVPAIGARRWGSVGFAEYAIVYRALAFLQPPLLLGLGVALPRLVGRLGATATERRTADDMLVTAMGLVAAAVLLVAASLMAGASFWSEVLFDDTGHRSALMALGALLLASCLTSLVTGYLRGRFRMAYANLLGIWYLGVSPLVAVLLTDEVSSVLLATAGLWGIGAVACSAAAIAGRRPVAVLVEHASRMLRFGLRRVPGEFALFGLFALPAVIAAHGTTLVRAGYLAFAVSTVTLAGSLFSPLTHVLLPHASNMLERGDVEALRAHLRKLIPWIVVLAVGGVGVVEAFAATGVVLYLGDDFREAAGLIRICALGIPGYIVFVSLRSSLDAYHDQAVSLRNAVFALVVFALATQLIPGDAANAVALAFVFGTTVLAALTVWDVRRTFFLKT